MEIKELLKGISVEKAIDFFYCLGLSRFPEDEAKKNAIAAIESEKLSLIDLYGQILDSKEFISNISYVDEEEIKRQYFFYSVLSSKALENVSLFVVLNSLSDRDFVKACYVFLLSRPPDDNGFNHYVRMLQNGSTRTRVIYDFIKSSEFNPQKIAMPLIKAVKFYERPALGWISKFIIKKFHIDELIGNRTEKSNFLGSNRKKLPLKTRIGACKSVINDSIERLRHVDNSSRKMAIISVNFSDETGIAYYNSALFGNRDSLDVHFFCPFSSVSDYAFSANRKDMKCFAIESIFSALSFFNYDSIIVVLGNSTHNLEAAIILDQLLSIKDLPLYIYLHDVILWNLVKKFYLFNNKNLNEKILLDYVSFSDYLKSFESGDYSKLVENKIYGIDYILSDRKPKGFIVNSDYAKNMLFNSIKNKSIDIFTLFIPVAEVFSKRSLKKSDQLVMGTFGVPGSDKMTDKVIESYFFLRENKKNIKLVIAGYGAKKYIKKRFSNRSAKKLGIAVFEPKKTSDLLNLMGSVDIAVQLRQRSNGESSGVIPQLISSDVDVITSNMGPFAEYSSVCKLVENDITSIELSEVVLKRIEETDRFCVDREKYVQNHNPEKCFSSLVLLLSS